MKKILTLFILYCLSMNPVQAYSEEDISVLDIQVYDLPIALNEKTINFYPTFKNNAAAFSAFSEQYADIITSLKEENELPELDDGNIIAYHTVLLNKLNAGDKMNDATFKLYTYFEAYLLKEENIKIHNVYDEYIQTLNEELLQELDLLTPYTSDKVFEGESAYTAFNVDSAVAYAETYANSYNSDYGYYTSGDCTNFASQIVHSGGIPIYNNGNFETGWYPGSASWIRANRFANWFGIWNYSKSHDWFSDCASRGDFVALDYGSNGSWDHIGFVTETDNYIGSWTDSNGITSQYKDYRIAQHSTDGNAWASWDSNHWDEAYYSNYSTYGIISTPH